MPITLRAARAGDFPFCEAIYFTEMDQIMTDLRMDKARHRQTFKAGWSAAQVQVIQLDGADVGWMQTWPEPDSLYHSQLFIEAPFQNRGLGAQVLTRLLHQTDAEGVPTTLSVVKSNPARRLYERHGFRLTHEDKRKFYMWREVGGGCETGGD
jgi:ribosomal protein S18 acetylase RimI-like enzyme